MFAYFLWVQGESDSDLTSERYAHYLSALIEAINDDLQSGQYSVPWVVARSSYNKGAVFDGPRDGVDAVDNDFFAARADEIRDAQKRRQESGGSVQSDGEGG